MDLKKREKIIEVSIKLFIQGGFHGTPTSLIAKNAGIATGTLFNYFKTKDILINEIFKEIKLEQNQNILKDFDEKEKNKIKLKKIWDNLICWGIKNPEKRQFLEYFSSSCYVTNETRKKIYESNEFLLKILDDIIETKNLKNTNKLMLLFNFIGTCMSTGKYYLLTKAEYNKSQSNEVFERFCKSIELTDEI